MKKWFEVNAAADGSSADIYIFGFIGDWIDDVWQFDPVTTAKSFVEALAKIPESVTTLRVRINSPGGDANGGITIANALRTEQARGRKVETIIEGLAASAASIVAMGGNPVRISDNGMLMIHAPWSISVGNAKEMRADADLLDQFRDTLVTTYQWHSNLSAEEIVALIDGKNNQGTWLDADAAIKAGFATEKIVGLKAAASLDPRALAKLKIPDKYRAQVDALLKPEPVAPVAASAADVLRICGKAGCLELAAELIDAHATVEDVMARADADLTRREAAAAAIADAQIRATARATQIRALCATARLADRADLYIKSALTIEDVKADLTGLTAKLDRVEIDGSLPADLGGRAKGQINTAEIYAARNRRAS